MRKVLILSLLATALYACHKESDSAADAATKVEADGAVELSVDATEVAGDASAVDAADIASPVTP